MFALLKLLGDVSYSYQTSTTNSTGVLALVGSLLVVIIPLAIIGIIASWKVYTKAGRPGWAAIVPFYNLWVLFEISGKPGWWALIYLTVIIPILGFIGGIAFLVLYIMAMLELARRFGKSTTFAVFGLIIFSFVGFLMLAFGKAQYNAAPSVVGNGPQPLPPAPTPTPPIAPAPPAAPVA